MMNPGEKSTPFEPSMVFREILRPVTRQAISRWLATHPTSADGDPVIAIHQALFCEPVRDLIRCRRKIPLPALKKNQYPGHTYQPIVHHNHGFGNLWNGEVTCNHMAQYREPFFFLSHDETYLRLVNSQLSILLQPQGSNIHLVHLAAGSLLISQACADGLLPADHDSADRAQASSQQSCRRSKVIMTALPGWPPFGK